MANNVIDLRDKKYGPEKFKSATARNRQLAADSGVSKNQIDRILNKTQGTSIDQLEWLAGALGVRPQDLVTPYFTRAQVTPITTAKRGKTRSS